MTRNLCFAILFGMAVGSAAAKELTFGTGADMSRLESIETLLAKPAAFADKAVTVKGEVKAVCHKKGCWMTIATEKDHKTLRVKVKDGDMVFPVSAKGRTAYATGTLKGKTLNKEQTIAHLAHMAKDGKESFDPSSVTSGMTIYQLVPTGVTIAD